MIPQSALERFALQTKATKTVRLIFKDSKGEQQGDAVMGRVSLIPVKAGIAESEQGGRLTAEVLAEISVDPGVVILAYYRIFAEFPNGLTEQYHVRTPTVLSSDQTELSFIAAKVQ